MTHEPGTSLTTLAPGPVASGPGAAARRLLLAVVAVSTVVIVASVSSASAAGSTVGVATSSNFGTVLTNAQGFALYTLPSDQNGMSSCSGSCATVWPALTVPAGTTPTAGTGVTGTVAAVMQSNGTDQVTYNGSPLYTFVGDTSAGEVTGNGVGGFAIVKVAPSTTPSTAAASTPTTAAPASPSTPTSAPSMSTPTSRPSETPPAQAPTGVATSSGGGTGGGSTAPGPGAVASAPTALAFTGPGPALLWMVVVGGGLLAVSVVMLVLLGDRRRLATTRANATRTGRWLLGR